MLQAVEGIYKDGIIHLSEAPEGVSESRVIVTFLSEQITPQTKMMTFGMLADPTSSNHESTEEDFRLAEYHDDSDDGPT